MVEPHEVRGHETQIFKIKFKDSLNPNIWKTWKFYISIYQIALEQIKWPTTLQRKKNVSNSNTPEVTSFTKNKSFKRFFQFFIHQREKLLTFADTTLFKISFKATHKVGCDCGQNICLEFE